MKRGDRPSALPLSPTGPQPLVSTSDDGGKVVASLPSGDRVEVLLHGATVTSWKGPNNAEQLFLSSKAALDGSKAVRGGIPVVFPVFGPPPKEGHATSSLPQHGFARNVRWEYLGKSSTESTGNKSALDSSVKLDFGLSSAQLDEKSKKAWPYEFTLVYSVTLSTGELGASLEVKNSGDKTWEFTTLLHTYFRIGDISKVSLTGLEPTAYTDKVGGAAKKQAAGSPITFTGETDRVYTDTLETIIVKESDTPKFEIVRDGMSDVVVWNPWVEKSKGMSDFGPEDGWKQMICVEAGAVKQFISLESGETWQGGFRARIPGATDD